MQNADNQVEAVVKYLRDTRLAVEEMVPVVQVMAEVIPYHPDPSLETVTLVNRKRILFGQLLDKMFLAGKYQLLTNSTKEIVKS